MFCLNATDWSRAQSVAAWRGRSPRRHEAMVQAAQLVDLDIATCTSDDAVPFQTWRSTSDSTPALSNAHANWARRRFVRRPIVRGRKGKTTRWDRSERSQWTIELLGKTGGIVGVIWDEPNAVFANKAEMLPHAASFRLLLNDKDHSLGDLLGLLLRSSLRGSGMARSSYGQAFSIPHGGLTDPKSGVVSHQGSSVVVFLDPPPRISRPAVLTAK